MTLARVLTPFAIANADPQPDPTRAAEMEIAAYHAALAGAGPVLTAAQPGGDVRYDVRLAFTGPKPAPPGPTTVRILSRSGGQHARPIEDSPAWPDVPLADVTTFIAVRTQVTEVGSETSVSAECVLKAQLEGVEQDRAAHILRSLLSSEEDVLSYLSFLLDESGAGGWGFVEDRLGEGPGDGAASRPTFDELALLETLVRAAGRGDESLLRVHALMKDLRDENGRSPVVSADFVAVWESVWAAVGTKDGTTT